MQIDSNIIYLRHHDMSPAMLYGNNTPWQVLTEFRNLSHLQVIFCISVVTSIVVTFSTPPDLIFFFFVIVKLSLLQVT